MSTFLRPPAPRGATLVEVVVYFALLVLIVSILTLLGVQTIRANTYAIVTQEEIANARAAVDAMIQEVYYARSVYAPTSVFGASPGQLSLETTRNVPTGDTTTYVDFYVDGGRLYRKRSGQAAEILTAERVAIKGLTFTLLNTSASAPSVRVSLTVAHETSVAGAGVQPTITLTTTAALRTN